MHGTNTQVHDRYGWPVNDWSKATGISRSSVYILIDENKIASVKHGAKRIITTHPRDYLASLT